MWICRDLIQNGNISHILIEKFEKLIFEYRKAENKKCTTKNFFTLKRDG